jgi:serine/threonine protein kinase
MADSLLDNRYRYDYIYPRGRSGETLRAVDTHTQRLVVIKRPAPNDAPPIRAGQEVSILNERKALMRLAGHPVLTALLETGQFSVGGVPHQYIVIERGEGVIIADEVLALAAKGESFPELEMLVITDQLLDLLEAAHAHDIVYNDVDAKHLFWNRDTHSLKVIDWGNAVFLEGDEITPQGVSRQSDIAQVGELLYFILTGGRRPDVPRDAGEGFRLDFGAVGEQVHSRMQSIISRAVHPNLRIRHQSISELRKELNDYRAPITRERDAVLARVSERLTGDRSREELDGLFSTLEPALNMDAGYPRSRELQTEIQARLQDLEIAADLDAVQIYLQSSNWTRATNLLDQLRGVARGNDATLVNLLFDFAIILHDAEVNPAPLPVIDSINLLFEGQPEAAGAVLMTQGIENETQRGLQWLLAERISSHVSDILLLRPSLYRLDRSLALLAREGVPVTEPRAVLVEINTELERMSAQASAITMSALRDGHRSVVDGLTALQTLLEAVNAGRNLSERKLPFHALDRALNAAMTLADNIHVIGKQAAGSPDDALEALGNSRQIDPNNRSWDVIHQLLDNLYELLGSYQTYVPNADGSDLAAWLQQAQDDLNPFVERLFDEMLVGMVSGLKIAAQSWSDYDNAALQGNRLGAVTALVNATNAVGTISPTLAGWFNHLRTLVSNAQYVERHALYGGLGRALADGWQNFDRGRLAEAEQLGDRALEIARSDSQRFAAGRLQKLAQLSREWVDRSGVNDMQRSQSTLVSVERLFTVAENEIHDNFTRQMPSKDTYLKAMGKGLVELYSRSSTAAVRILFMSYILQGALAAQQAAMDDADFWLDAASRTLEADGAKNHVALYTLSEYIGRRQDILGGAAQINTLTSGEHLPALSGILRDLEHNPQARTLSPGAQSLQELQSALRDWSDGEFRAAGGKLENAIRAAQEMEHSTNVSLAPYRTWLGELQASVAELYTRAREMRELIESRPDAPNEQLQSVHQRQYEMTQRLLGAQYAETLKQWNETYHAFHRAYEDPTTRRSAKLTRFNELFRAMFIDRHPAYPLYRHWYNVTEQAPEFPAPPTEDPTPRIDEGVAIAEDEYRVTYDDAPTPAQPKTSGRALPWPLILGGVGVLMVLAVLAAVFGGGGEPAAEDMTLTLTEPSTLAETLLESDLTLTEAAANVGLAVTEAPSDLTPTLPFLEDFATATLFVPELRSAGEETLEPTLLPTETPIPPTATPAPTETPLPTITPSLTFTPSSTPTATITPTATLPPQGLQGRQDLLALIAGLENPTWDPEQFSGEEDRWRLGIGASAGGDIIYITPPLEALATLYGNDPANRITRAEATLTLETYNPPLLIDNAVFFGMVLQNTVDPTDQRGLQVQLAEPGVINLAHRNNDSATTISQRSIGAIVVRVRLDYDWNTGTVLVFFNDQQIGQAFNFAPQSSVIPALFVKEGGVIVSVTQWNVSLR